MTHLLAKAALGAVAALVLGGAAHAAEINITIRTPDRGSAHDTRYYGGDDERRSIPSSWEYDRRGADRFYGRPVRDVRSWDRSRWVRPIDVQPRWEHDDDCRTTIKRRVNAWGEVIVKHIEMCD